ncbi:hypothetical protein FQZ97_775370 [compost metagenome]
MGHGVGDVQALLMGGAAVDLDGDELGGALAVADDGLGDFHGHLQHRLLQRGEQRAAGLGDFRQGGLAGGDQHAAVVGRGIAVDGDAVERLVRRVAQQVLQHALGHLGVGGEVAEHGRHVRLDHPGALADAGDGDGHTLMDELAAGALGQGVGGHDAFGGGGPVVRPQVGEGGRQRGFDLFYRQRFADHPGGERQHRIGRHAGQLGELGAGVRGIDQARLAGAGVGVAGVGQQVAHRTEEALLADDHRRRAEGIEGEHPRHAGAFGAAHHHHVLAPRALDAGRGDAEFEAGNRMQGGQGTETDSHGERSLLDCVIDDRGGGL